ncbi:hypothetical protein FSOLCH5_012329 [Fusarium solani]|uniref:CFEM domain-containing protein n=1 Tax=Fusarium solani TaxID=169388 RepID=A0A9P9GYN5_FUSSL|nr:uncharacterized protein B0J15DRAFT_500101 [Fusarium solani]XP_053014019.1 CFEM domain-containing protein [Fusarium falciforme]KAH7247089.1 hypothetical protein B0J15DRAFT_500101 [Fusarium solani]KAJ3457758.1 hypothetical protein MRS44_014899 [Fusarium solani]KAJ4205253.1 hypothetical protein NW767_004047 [Fusarium falciforme]KAJ4219468.1 hypothetical protein NW759_007858 [Fusarium solani]WAO95209.1 CFEM domain-containing protein [Fusarium falciforme]
MKVSAFLSTVAVTLASIGSANAATPLCAITCFTAVMNHEAAKTCTEANMFLCMCKIKALTLAYRDCACSSCLLPQSKLDAIATGKDICNQYNAPVDWLPDTCPSA